MSNDDDKEYYSLSNDLDELRHGFGVREKSIAGAKLAGKTLFNVGKFSLGALAKFPEKASEQLLNRDDLTDRQRDRLNEIEKKYPQDNAEKKGDSDRSPIARNTKQSRGKQTREIDTDALLAKKMSIIATKGTLDGAYPVFILASTAAALGYEVQIFFTFYGLQLLKKDLSHIKTTPIANPALPIAMPVIAQMLPGIESMTTQMMKKKIAKHGIASIEELRDLCLECEVEFVACQMTVDLFEFDKKELISGIKYGGTSRILGFAGESDICLYM